MSSPFLVISLAIVRGFLRDKASVFFALIFPLMFLVLFGGLFGDQTQSKVEMVQVGDLALLDDLTEADARNRLDDLTLAAGRFLWVARPRTSSIPTSESEQR